MEAAYERTFLKDGAATLTVRHSELSDVIDRAPVFAPSGDLRRAGQYRRRRSKDELIGDLSMPLQAGFGIDGRPAEVGPDLAALLGHRPHHRRAASRSRACVPSRARWTSARTCRRWKLSWGGELNVGWRQRYYRFNQIETDAFAPHRVGVRGGAAQARLERARGAARPRRPATTARLADWADVRGPGVAFAELDDRDLALGPDVYFRVRRNW